MARPQVFAQNIIRRANQVVENAPKVTGRAALAAVTSLAQNTPVLTSLARSNWVVGIGGPDLSIRGFRSISAVINEARSKLATLDADQEAHVANGGDKVPYLGLLNRGSSGNAPAGFVNGSIFDAIAAVQNATLLKG